MRKAPHYIAIDGPLRVGKTKLARALADHIRGRCVLDPTENPHLEDLYRGRAGAAFRAQMQFLFARFQRLSETGPGKSQLPVVTDFLFEKDKLYAYLNLDDIEIELYNPYYGFFKQQLPQPDLTVYLKATAESLHARLSAERSGLESRISEAYLDGFVRAYDYFFDRYKAADILVVDTVHTDIVNRRKDLEDVLQELSRPVTGTQFFLPLGS